MSQYHTVVELIKHRKMKLVGCICRMEDKRLVSGDARNGRRKRTMWKAAHPEDGLMTSLTGATAQFQ